LFSINVTNKKSQNFTYEAIRVKKLKIPSELLLLRIKNN